jgi:hypothetical protein
LNGIWNKQINIYAGEPEGFLQQRGISPTPLPHPGDVTGMSEPCGALPRKCLFIRYLPHPRCYMANGAGCKWTAGAPTRAYPTRGRATAAKAPCGAYPRKCLFIYLFIYLFIRYLPGRTCVWRAPKSGLRPCLMQCH